MESVGTIPLSGQDVDFAGVDLKLERRESRQTYKVMKRMRRLVTEIGKGEWLWMLNGVVYREKRYLGRKRWTVFEGEYLVTMGGILI